MPDVYLHVYVNKVVGGDLYKNLHSQKPRRKRYLCGRDRRAQIPKRAARSASAPVTWKSASK